MILTLLAAMAASSQDERPSFREPTILSGRPGDADYPAEARRRRERGTTRYRLTISEEGRTIGCLVVVSSGSPSLDAAGCGAFIARTRWLPAKDASGASIAATVDLPVVWRMPKAKPVQAGAVSLSAVRSPDGQPVDCLATSEGGAPQPPRSFDLCSPWNSGPRRGGLGDLAVFFRQHRRREDLRFVSRLETSSADEGVPDDRPGQVQQLLLLRNLDTLACARWMNGAGPLFFQRGTEDCEEVAGLEEARRAVDEGSTVLITSTLSVVPNLGWPPQPSD